MTEEILYTGLLKSAELPIFIENCGFTKSSSTYFLAEHLPTRVVEPGDRQDLLTFAFFEPDLPFADYTSGRIFSEQGELRWEKQDGQVRVIYLGNPAFASVKRAVADIYRSHFKEKNLELKKLDQRKRFYYLFGTKLEMRTIEQINGQYTKNAVKVGDFAELRIHRILRYPAPGHVPDKGYVQLQVQEYVDRESGHVQFFRFQGLDEERQDVEREQAR